MANCPECGFESGSVTTCQTIFDECLIKEFEDPAFGAVHHLTVAAYMLQHSSKLSMEGWLAMRELLREFLIENKPPDLVRKEYRKVVDNGKRKWKFSSPDNLPKIRRSIWTRTIGDVHRSDSVVYCSDVTDWAWAVLKDSDNPA